MLDKASGVKILLAILVLLLLPVGAHADDLFDAARIFPLTYAGDMVKAADLTGDGNLDLVTARIRLSVMIGDGHGSFTDVEETTGVLSPVSLAVGDLNGDTIPDVVLGDDYGVQEGLLRVLLGNGDGTFFTDETYPTVEHPHEMHLGDLDGDGDLDLVTMHLNGDQVVAHLNNGNGAFGPAMVLLAADIPADVLLQDLNGDEILDLAVVCWSGQDLHICLGNGDGTFTVNQVFPFSDPGRGVAAGDIDSDGSLDLVVTTYGNGPAANLHILKGDGSGDFSMFQERTIAGILGPPQLVRLDGDQVLDIVLDSDDELSALIGNGDGTFGAITYSGIRLETNSRWVLEDPDRDGDPDLIMPINSMEAGMTVVRSRGDGTWQMAPPVRARDSVSWAEASDVDLDGDLDVVMAHEDYTYTAAVTTLENAGDGTFSRILAWTAEWGYVANHLSVAELNGDGIPDLAVTCFDHSLDQGMVAILIGAGDGTFFMPSSFLKDGEVFQSHLWLVDGDAHHDLVAVCFGEVWLRLGDGEGGFGDEISVDAVNWPTLADAADLDNNGTLDLVVSSRASGRFSVCLGDGSGGFSAPVEYVTDQDWISLNLGDLDLDGAPDLVYSHEINPLDTLCVRLNDGSGAFLEETVSSERLNVGPCRLADINADGLLDVVSANSESISVHPGLGNGGVGPVHRFNMFSDIVYMPAPGDYDGDGDLDLVVGRNAEVNREGLYFRNTRSLGTIFAAGPGPGMDNPTMVKLFTWVDAVQPVSAWLAYSVSRYGVNTALGELDGEDGVEVVTGPGPGAVFGPHVRGFEMNGIQLPGVSFLAYGTQKYGVNVACGDLDADGFAEIITGAGPGAVFGPHVRGWNWDGSGNPAPIPGISYFAYGTPKWGVNVSCGDIDGDGFDEIVTGAGPGAVYGPHVRGWDCDGGEAAPIPGVSFFAYGTIKWGVNVSCGDIDGDGIDEIITGAGPGEVFGPHVRGWNWDGSGTAQSIPGVSFFAYDYPQWGAYVGCGDLDGDGIDEILTGPGPGPTHAPRVRGWNYDGATLTAIGPVDFDAFDPGEVTHGVKPAGLRASRR